ncbi:winged helix DNA-binding domain-containing protein [Agrococcus terreus]|uniref:DNA glycosylase AlkZ-like family protein n=1 Tax=Agrococcus terreus TaxID=574649 RepID=UPI00384C4A5C
MEPRSLTAAQARRVRLAAHGFGADRSPAEAMRALVAMQGQDLPAVLRAIAIRSAAGTTLADVRDAFGRGELVRSWAMRGTLFATTPRDLAILHAATGERMRRQELRMLRDREVPEAVGAQAAEVAADALAAGPLARPALLAAWEAAGIATSGGHGYHLLALLAIEQRVRFGPFDGAEQLLVGGPPAAVADPAAAHLDLLARVVASRGPIRGDDVAWWTGLPKVPIRAALAAAPGLEPVLVEGVPMRMRAGLEPLPRDGVRLVPAFDEWLLGAADRSLVASPAALAAVVPGGNGVFRPTVLVDGRVVGTWSLPAARARAGGDPEATLVEPVPAAASRALERALAAWPHR